MQEIPSDLISMADAIDLIPGRRKGKKICASTVYRWVSCGKLRAWRVAGGHLCVSRADVLALIQPAEVVKDLPGKPQRMFPEGLAEKVLRARGIKI